MEGVTGKGREWSEVVHSRSSDNVHRRKRERGREKINVKINLTGCRSSGEEAIETSFFSGSALCEGDA